MGRLLRLLALLPALAMAQPEPLAPAADDVVMLLHGMGRTRWSLALLERDLRRAGYSVVNATYPCRRLDIARLSREWLAPRVAAAVPPGGRVHFVTHSLGGILVRQFAADHPEAPIGRVVMLAPPNQGSELSDWMARWTIPRWWTGPALRELGTGPEAVPNRLGPAPFACGVLAGDRSLNPLFSLLFDGPNDGKVSVARTALSGMADRRVLPYSHTWLMNRQDCRREVLHFLRTGRFSPPDPSSGAPG
jgi:pimeloyl-ACP methyl ester carboxylesterase